MTKKPPFTLQFVQVGDCAAEVARDLYKHAVSQALENIGVVAYNLDEIACKYISEDARYGSSSEKGPGLCTGLD